MTYNLAFKPGFVRDLDGLHSDARGRVLAAVEALSEDPTPENSKALAGPLRGLRRLRVGSYRVAYVMDRRERRIIVLCAGTREGFHERARQRVR